MFVNVKFVMLEIFLFFVKIYDLIFFICPFLSFYFVIFFCAVHNFTLTNRCSSRHVMSNMSHHIRYDATGDAIYSFL